MGDVQGRGEQTREALIDAAYEQFTKRGFHGTSMRSIAQEAGVAVGGIYNHFSGKDDIFKAVVLAHHPLTRLLPKLDQVQGETVENLLRHLMQQIVTELEAEPRMFNLLLIEMIECQGRHLPVLREQLLPQLLTVLQRVTVLADDLPALPPLALAQIFIGSVFTHWFTGRLLRQAGVPEEMLADADLFADVLLHGLLSRSS